MKLELEALKGFSTKKAFRLLDARKRGVVDVVAIR